MCIIHLNKRDLRPKFGYLPKICKRYGTLMLYQDSSLNNTQNYNSVTEEPIRLKHQSNSDIKQELDELENCILDGVNVPLTDLKIVDGGIVLDRLKSIKHNLPTVLAASIEILQQRQAIIQQANIKAQEIVNSARAEAESLLRDSNLLRQTEIEARQIKFETEQECQQLRQAAFAEIEQWREMATLEYEAIQNDADNYASAVLGDLEAKLTQMLAVVQNGRQHLESDADS